MTIRRRNPRSDQARRLADAVAVSEPYRRRRRLLDRNRNFHQLPVQQTSKLASVIVGSVFTVAVLIICIIAVNTLLNLVSETDARLAEARETQVLIEPITNVTSELGAQVLDYQSLPTSFASNRIDLLLENGRSTLESLGAVDGDFLLESREEIRTSLAESLAQLTETWRIAKVSQISDRQVDTMLRLNTSLSEQANRFSEDLRRSEMDLEQALSSDREEAKFLSIGAIIIGLLSTFAVVVVIGRTSSQRIKNLRNDLKGQIEDFELSRNTFLDVVNRELRDPLTPILGLSEMLFMGESALTENEKSDLINVIYENALRLSDLTSNVLVLMKIQTGSYEPRMLPFDALSVIRTGVRKATLIAESYNVQIRFENPEFEATAQGDAEELARAFRIILLNAIRYSKPHQTVEVRVESELDDGRQVLRVEVIDRGIGIPADEIRNVTLPFWRGSNAVEEAISGAGLGLHVANRVLTELRATWSIMSEEGFGTTVIVKLPCEILKQVDGPDSKIRTTA